MKHQILYESPYEYGVFSSDDRRSGRFYDCNGVKLPSVTTILSGTKEGDFLKKWIDKVGEENILFETDFPHPTSLFGDEVHRRIDEGLGDCDESVREKILWSNAEKLYKVEPPPAHQKRVA